MYGLGFMGSITCICFISPTLSLHLASYQVSENLFGVFFAIPTFSYVVTVFIIRKLNCSKRSVMAAGLVILIFGNLMIGPWEYTFLPHRLYMCAFGLVLMGFGLCTCNLTGAPMVIQLAQMRFPEYTKESVSDVASGLVTFMNYLPEIYSPPLSGLLRDRFGFENAQAILALGMAALLVIFIIFTRTSMTRQTNNEVELQKLEILE